MRRFRNMIFRKWRMWPKERQKNRRVDREQNPLYGNLCSLFWGRPKNWVVLSQPMPIRLDNPIFLNHNKFLVTGSHPRGTLSERVYLDCGVIYAKECSGIFDGLGQIFRPILVLGYDDHFIIKIFQPLMKLSIHKILNGCIQNSFTFDQFHYTPHFSIYRNG